MSALILGAGIAGTLLARALALRGVAVTVLDAGPTRRASAVPGALLHAHPGRKLHATPLEHAAFQVAWQTVERWAEALPGAVWRGDIVRPLTGSNLARKLAAQDLPDHIQRLDAATLAARCPLLPVTEAIGYGPAAMLTLPAILDHERAALVARGVTFLDAEATALTPTPRGWRARTAGGEEIEAECVALCCGVALGRWLPALGVGVSGGELGLWAPLGALDCAISGGAHVAPRADGQWVAGSTYLRAESWEELEAAPADDAHLTQRVAALLPALADHAPLHTWRGCRASVGPDRAPIACAAPLPGLWVLGGLGSRGLLLAPLLAEQLATQIVVNPRPATPHQADMAPWRLLSHLHPTQEP